MARGTVAASAKPSRSLPQTPETRYRRKPDTAATCRRGNEPSDETNPGWGKPRTGERCGRTMDRKLLAWGHAARHRGARLPVLWLFTDSARLPDPRDAVARLPRGLAGVVLRHDADPARARLGRDLARICRGRRLALVVAGDVRLAAALGAGVHLRDGRWPGRARPLHSRSRLITSSAHDGAAARRARRDGADLVFLSPAFLTASHPGAPALGPARWTAMVRAAAVTAAALGGVDGGSIRRLPWRYCRAAGAIGALA